MITYNGKQTLHLNVTTDHPKVNFDIFKLKLAPRFRGIKQKKSNRG